MPEFPEETSWEFILIGEEMKICHKDIYGALWEWTRSGFRPVDKFQAWIHEVLRDADYRMD